MAQLHHREHGGPIRIDEENAGSPAIYSGSVTGDTMTMTVKLADSDEVVETFTLKRGGAGRVFNANKRRLDRANTQVCRTRLTNDYSRGGAKF